MPLSTSSSSASLRTFIEDLKQAAKKFRQLAAESNDYEVQQRYFGLASALDNMIERAEADAQQLGL